jgi:hypothetical protein
VGTLPSYSAHGKEERPPADPFVTHNSIIHGSCMLPEVVLGDGIFAEFHGRFGLRLLHGQEGSSSRNVLKVEIWLYF